MRITKGGAVEVGRFGVTIAPNNRAEVKLLSRFALCAARRMPDRPNIFQPHNQNVIILSFPTMPDINEVGRLFREALDACKAEAEAIE